MNGDKSWASALVTLHTPSSPARLFCGHHGDSDAFLETLETLWPRCCCCCENTPIVKETNSLKTSMWAGWAEMFAEIPELETDF